MRAAPKARAACAQITPIGPGTRDEDRGSRRDVRLAHGGDGDRQRFQQRGGLVGHRIRYRMGEFGVDGDVAAERAVDRRRRVELHVRAQVVATGGALLAAPARMLRLDGDALADAGRVDLLADRGDAARQLVAEDHRLLDDEVADPAVAVVVHVGSADADRGHLDEHLVGPGVGTGRSSICSVPTPVITLARMVSSVRSYRFPSFGCQVEPGRRPSDWTPAAAHSGATSSVTPPSTATGRSENRVVQAVTRAEPVQPTAVAGAGLDEHHQDAVGVGGPPWVAERRPIPATPRSTPRRPPRGSRGPAPR